MPGNRGFQPHLGCEPERRQLSRRVRTGGSGFIGGGDRLTSTTHVDNPVEGLVLGTGRGRPGACTLADARAREHLGYRPVASVEDRLAAMRSAA